MNQVPAASAGELGHVCDEGLRPPGKDAPARRDVLGTADSSGEDLGLTKESLSLPATGQCFPHRPE